MAKRIPTDPARDSQHGATPLGEEGTGRPVSGEGSSTRPRGQEKKGRPTPKRREAEAARRKPLVVTDRKAAKKAEREERAAERARVRQGMLDGDDRYLGARDRGAVRAYVRDRVDGRFTVGEVMLPVLLLLLVGTVAMMFLPNVAPWVRTVVFVAVYGLLLYGLLDAALLARRLRAEIPRVFPKRADEASGHLTYVVLRSFQMRGARTPRVRVSHGEQPLALR